ncbi:MAG: metallophosphoesterase [Planctomycetes bacterium]|nr:metallophosphoesterase [Planctomycetota bacterium]
MTPRPSPPPTDWVPQRRYSKWRTRIFRAFERVAVACGGRAFYRRRYLRADRLVVREEVVRVPGLPPALEGLRIVQWGDLHAGPFLRCADLAGVVERTRALEPDLFVLTGDYITRHCSEGVELAPALARVQAPLGAFAVFGNHDYKDRAEGEIADAYAAVGVRVLRDECARLERGGAFVAVVGVEDLEEARSVDIERARADVRPGDVELVLCHNPAGARRLAREGCAVVFAGHTHGTQVDLPLLRRVGPKHPGLRMQFGATRLVVTRGLGVVGFPLRVGAPAEIVLVRLTSGEAT